MAFTVEEKHLATRVIDEFISKNQGILSSSALIAIGAVKRNSRRILAKFNPDMDGAFLLHRALLLHTDESFESLPGLIAEEFQAVVEDKFAQLGNLGEVLQEGVAHLEIAPPAKQWNQDAGKNEKGNNVTKPVSEKDFENIAKSFLTGGVDGIKGFRNCIEVRKLSEDARNITRSIDPEVIRTLRDAVDKKRRNSNERLASLFNSRTYYDQQIRFLTLGTVVRLVNGDKSEYSLCIIPVCDSVRLRKEHPVEFPFLRLNPGPFGSRPGNGCVVEDSQDKLIELIAATKIRNLHLERFIPKAGPGIIEAEKNGKGFWIKAESGKTYEWIGQLKPSHAQRIAHEFGQALSRVGLSEAEWVRLLCDRD